MSLLMIDSSEFPLENWKLTVGTKQEFDINAQFPTSFDSPASQPPHRMSGSRTVFSVVYGQTSCGQGVKPSFRYSSVRREI